MMLPDEAPCSLGGPPLTLRYYLPRIWTQPTGRPFGIYWSNALSYGRLWPKPTPDELAAFYKTDTYDRYLSGQHSAQAPRATVLSRLAIKLAWMTDHSVPDPIPTVLSLAPPGPRICDLGCGGGAFLERMRETGASPTGVDPSPVSETALLSKRIEFYRGTAEHLPTELTGRSFDVVTMFQSLEHCADPVRAVRNAASLLAANGLLVIDVPNMNCAGFNTYRQVWWHTDAGRHLHFLTKQSLTALLDQAGLRPIKWEYQGFAHQFAQSWIDEMARAWDAVGGYDETPRPSLLRSLSYLPAALLSDDRRYEIIRVYSLGTVY